MPTITFMEAMKRKQDEKSDMPRSVFWRYCHCGHVSGKIEQYAPCDACGKRDEFFHYRIEEINER